MSADDIQAEMGGHFVGRIGWRMQWRGRGQSFGGRVGRFVECGRPRRFGRRCIGGAERRLEYVAQAGRLGVHFGQQGGGGFREGGRIGRGMVGVEIRRERGVDIRPGNGKFAKPQQHLAGSHGGHKTRQHQGAARRGGKGQVFAPDVHDHRVGGKGTGKAVACLDGDAQNSSRFGNV